MNVSFTEREVVVLKRGLQHQTAVAYSYQSCYNNRVGNNREVVSDYKCVGKNSALNTVTPLLPYLYKDQQLMRR